METPAYSKLLHEVQKHNDLIKASAVLGWDREVNMPAAGHAERSHQIKTLQLIAHDILHSDEFDLLLDESRVEATDTNADADSDMARLIEKLDRDRTKSAKLPKSFIAERSVLSSAAWQEWKAARANDDFARFEPYLEQLIDLQRRYVEYIGFEDDPYDALLNDYELGLTTADVRKVFESLRNESQPLIEAIAGQTTSGRDEILHQDFEIHDQDRFCRKMARAVGYDFERGHLGTAVHPFASSFSRNDARITTRWSGDFLNPALFGTLHEAGHAMYEQGTSASLSRTPLARGTSSGVHESQSRLIENLVGRSLGFWRRHYPELQSQFPNQLENVTLDAFYKAINHVQSSLIRVEADELTYNMHIILRFELEQEMLAGRLSAKDLPEAWRQKMRDLLGIEPPNDQLGCLQDVHWSGPSFGYFPTYTLGNLYASQLLAAATEANPSIASDLEEGQIEGLLTWLREEIHQHGSKFPPSELIQRATGSALTHKPFVEYATEKFSQLYEL